MSSGVAVALLRARRRGDAGAAVGARHEAVERRREVARLRAVDAEVARLLVDLPFHRIEGVISM